VESLLAASSSKVQRYLRTQRGVQVRLDSIVEFSDDAIITKDLDGTITSWNAAAARMFGYAPEEIIGRSILTLIPPELHQEEHGILAKLRMGERIDHFETVRLRKNGSRIDVSLMVSPLKDEEGNVIGASKIARDIGDRLRVDELRFRLAAIVESSDDAIISKDLNGIITSWNRGAERVFGWSEKEIVGRSVLTLIPQNLQHEEPEILRKLRAGERIDHFNTERVHKDGHLVDVSLTISPVKNAQGQVIGASKVARDITEHGRLQQALIESEKLAAAGRMAASIAHEINNPLEAMTNLAYLLHQDNSLNAEAKGFAKLLVEEIERASEVARRTLSFHREATHAVDIDVCELLDSVLASNHATLERKGIKVWRDFRTAAKIYGFRSEIRQVFANLIANAIDAISKDGELFVRVSRDPSSRDANGRFRVTILDNGNGISESAKQKIFRPFFTTKSAGGNGLGLWVSQGIVAKHGGKILFKSRTTKGKSGTAFTVFLPVGAK
jgi:PAS domain S-box-containing protein